MGNAILAPELVFSSGNVYAPEEDEQALQEVMQENFLTYFEKANGGSVQRIGRFADPTTVQIIAGSAPSTYEDFRKVEAKVGNDEWIDYARHQTKLAVVVSAPLWVHGVYHFDGGTANALLRGVRSYLQLVGGFKSSYMQGKFGQGITSTSTAVGNSVTCAHPISKAVCFTSFWFKQTSAVARQLLSAGTDVMALDSAGNLTIGTASVATSQNDYHHVVLIVDTSNSNVMHLWVDGVYYPAGNGTSAVWNTQVTMSVCKDIVLDDWLVGAAITLDRLPYTVGSNFTPPSSADNWTVSTYTTDLIANGQFIADGTQISSGYIT